LTFYDHKQHTVVVQAWPSQSLPTASGSIASLLRLRSAVAVLLYDSLAVLVWRLALQPAVLLMGIAVD